MDLAPAGRPDRALIGEPRRRTPIMADLVAQDREGRPVLLVPVKSAPAVGDAVVARMMDSLRASLVPFGMIVDPERIQLFRSDADQPESPVLTLDTRAILSHYDEDYRGGDPESGSRRVFGIYLAALVGAWLRDLAYRWKGVDPPALKALGEIGLPPLLEGGTTTDEITARDHALR
jgi:hypothetical protein